MSKTDTKSKPRIKPNAHPDVKLYIRACRRDEKARASVRGWEPAKRQKFADSYLRGVAGKALDTWVTYGMTMSEQRELATQDRITRELLEAAAKNHRKARKSNTNQKEANMAKNTKTDSKPATKRARNTERKARTRQPVAEGRITAAAIATECKTEAKVVRKVLRANGIAKDKATGQYSWPSLKSPTVRKVVKLVKAELANA